MFLQEVNFTPVIACYGEHGKNARGGGGAGGGSRAKDNGQVIYTVSPNKVYGLKYFCIWSYM